MQVDMSCRFDPWAGNIPWRRAWQSTLVFLVFPGGSDSKESTCNAGDLGSVLGWEHPLEEGMAIHSNILAWRSPMDRGAWRVTDPEVAKSQTQLSD